MSYLQNVSSRNFLVFYFFTFLNTEHWSECARKCVSFWVCSSDRNRVCVSECYREHNVPFRWIGILLLSQRGSLTLLMMMMTAGLYKIWTNAAAWYQTMSSIKTLYVTFVHFSLALLFIIFTRPLPSAVSLCLVSVILALCLFTVRLIIQLLFAALLNVFLFCNSALFVKVPFTLLFLSFWLCPHTHARTPSLPLEKMCA